MYIKDRSSLKRAIELRAERGGRDANRQGILRRLLLIVIDACKYQAFVDSAQSRKGNIIGVPV